MPARGSATQYSTVLKEVKLDTMVWSRVGNFLYPNTRPVLIKITLTHNQRFSHGRRWTNPHALVHPRAHCTMHETPSLAHEARLIFHLLEKITLNSTDLGAQPIYRSNVYFFPAGSITRRNHHHRRCPLPPSPLSEISDPLHSESEFPI